MATRASITLSERLHPTDDEVQHHIYRHWDGYPSGMIPDLVRAAEACPGLELDALLTSLLAVLPGVKEGSTAVMDGPVPLEMGIQYQYHLYVQDRVLQVEVRGAERQSTLEVLDTGALFNGKVTDALVWAKDAEG